MDQLSKVRQWIGNNNPGVEIGAFKTPLPGIKPTYVDKYAVFANERCLADFQGEATSLPFRSCTLAYVASSHVLEHVANPVKALLEWDRVLRPGGIMYIVVPDRRYTWDRKREITSVDHMIRDYLEFVSPVDGTHIDDFVDNLDWATYSPITPVDEVPEAKRKLKEVYWAAVNSGQEINIHFHVFEPQNIRELVETVAANPRFGVDWDVLDIQERFPDENPNGILLVVKSKKGYYAYLKGWTSQIASKFFGKTVLTQEARPFD